MYNHDVDYYNIDLAEPSILNINKISAKPRAWIIEASLGIAFRANIIFIMLLLLSLLLSILLLKYKSKLDKKCFIADHWYKTENIFFLSSQLYKSAMVDQQ